MKVYLLLLDFGVEGMDIHSVWGDELLAHKEATRLNTHNSGWIARVENYAVRFLGVPE